MIKVEFKPVVDAYDIYEEVGVHFQECAFADLADNGSYTELDLSDKHLEKLKEEIEWEQGKSSIRLKKLQGDLRVIEALRALVPCDSILVYIFW